MYFLCFKGKSNITHVSSIGWSYFKPGTVSINPNPNWPLIKFSLFYPSHSSLVSVFCVLCSVSYYSLISYHNFLSLLCQL